MDSFLYLLIQLDRVYCTRFWGVSSCLCASAEASITAAHLTSCATHTLLQTSTLSSLPTTTTMMIVITTIASATATTAMITTTTTAATVTTTIAVAVVGVSTDSWRC
jgi:hypothetical protein